MSEVTPLAGSHVGPWCWKCGADTKGAPATVSGAGAKWGPLYTCHSCSPGMRLIEPEEAPVPKPALLTDEAVHALRARRVFCARMREGSPDLEGAEAFLRHHAAEGREALLGLIELLLIPLTADATQRGYAADAIVTALVGERDA